MDFTIVYDNEVLREDLRFGWGFSAYIEASGKRILFDTGWDGNDLLYNMRVLGVNPKLVDVVVLSHQHWDHIGGLNHVLEEADDPVVYVPASFSDNLCKQIESKAQLMEVTAEKEIADRVYTTGELSATFKSAQIMEQSLALKTANGVLVVTGCSHPGLEKILEKAKAFGRLYGVVGGFHGFDRYEALEGLKLIVPTHCTQHRLEIRERYTQSFDVGGVGYRFSGIMR